MGASCFNSCKSEAPFEISNGVSDPVYAICLLNPDGNSGVSGVVKLY